MKALQIRVQKLQFRMSSQCQLFLTCSALLVFQHRAHRRSPVLRPINQLVRLLMILPFERVKSNFGCALIIGIMRTDSTHQQNTLLIRFTRMYLSSIQKSTESIRPKIHQGIYITCCRYLLFTCISSKCSYNGKSEFMKEILNALTKLQERI